MTKNQASMAMRKTRTNLKQAMALKELFDTAGDAIDNEDEEYLFMKDSVRECAVKLKEVNKMLETYAKQKI